MVRSRTFSSFQPRRRIDQNADRRQTVEIQIGTISATTQKLLWLAASAVKITKVSLLSESTVPGANESYWTFQIYNRTKGDFELFSTAPTTKPGVLGAITADTEYNLGVDQNLWVAENDVLDLVLTKTASAGNIDNAMILLEYEVEEGPIPSIAVTTTSTSTTTTTTTTTSTTTTTTTTTTSSSTTTTSSSTTTTSSSTTTTSSSTTTTTTTTTTISTTTTIT